MSRVAGLIAALFLALPAPFAAAVSRYTYNDWFLDRPFVVVLLRKMAAKFLMTMQEYPPSQAAGSFNLEKTQKMIEFGAGSK